MDLSAQAHHFPHAISQLLTQLTRWSKHLQRHIRELSQLRQEARAIEEAVLIRRLGDAHGEHRKLCGRLRLLRRELQELTAKRAFDVAAVTLAARGCHLKEVVEPALWNKIKGMHCAYTDAARELAELMAELVWFTDKYHWTMEEGLWLA